MPINFVSGDPTLTTAQTLAFGHNATGRIEMGILETLLHQRYPAAFSSYNRQCRNDRITTGRFWIWHETKPHLCFMVVRDSAVGATRLRHVQNIALTIARDYRLEGIKSLAIAPLGRKEELPEIHKILNTWFAKSKLQVIVYDDYQAGVKAEENIIGAT